jgi:hypothetical protein
MFVTIQDMIRLLWLFLVLGFFWSTPSFAYEVIENTTKVPYEVFIVDAESPVQQLFIGELNDFPEMFEIKSDVDFLLTVQIRTLPKIGQPLPNLNGIIVRDKVTRGVEEVARLNSGNANWELLRDKISGLPYQAGTIFSEQVPAGTYRIEVSTPQNLGKYILVVGSKPQPVGYFSSLQSVNDMYLFYGTSRIFMIRSPLIYYPVIIILLGGLAGWWWKRKRKHA